MIIKKSTTVLTSNLMILIILKFYVLNMKNSTKNVVKKLRIILMKNKFVFWIIRWSWFSLNVKLIKLNWEFEDFKQR